MTAIVQLTLTLEQARAVSDACELYARLGTGQLREVARLVRIGEIKTFSGAIANYRICKIVETKMNKVRLILGYPNSASLGITNENLTMRTRRTWEIKQVIDKICASQPTPLRWRQ
jgi:hypothetical protein